MTNMNDIFNQYVPESGNADTVGGEILRAINYLLMVFDEEKERLGCSDFAEAYVNPAGRYLYRVVDDDNVKHLLDKCWGKDAFSKLVKYETRLNNLSAHVVKWVADHPELFNTKNNDNYEDEPECPLDKKNALGFDFSRDFGASLGKSAASSKKRHQ